MTEDTAIIKKLRSELNKAIEKNEKLLAQDKYLMAVVDKDELKALDGKGNFKPWALKSLAKNALKQ